MLVAQVVEVVEVVEVLNGVRPNGHRSRLALRTRETDLAFASYMEGCGSNNSDYNVVCCNDHKMLAMHMSEAVNLKSRGSLKPGCALMHCPHSTVLQLLPARHGLRNNLAGQKHHRGCLADNHCSTDCSAKRE